jgi:DNA-binding IclR family transcriptional regulator
VGLGVLGLAHQVHPLLREAALPALRALAEDIGATAHLTLVDGTEALAVAVVEPTWTDYHVAYRTGFRHPLDRGAAGRAILAGRGMQPTPDGGGWEHADAEEVAEVAEVAELALRAAVAGEVLDGTDRLIGAGGATNHARYVITSGELEAGAAGAAAPLLGVPGIEGSVGVVMLAESVPERVGMRVVEAATEVSEALR